MTDPLNTVITSKTRNGIIAWCLYDWANTAYPIIITTFIFATYFTQSVARNVLVGTAQWGDMIAISGLIIALLSPILGAIADHSGRRKPWVACFGLANALCAGLLWFAYPSETHASYLLSIIAIGVITLELSNVFYNAMLRFLVSEDRIGRLSGWGWGCGYFGGLIGLVLCLLLFVGGGIHGLDNSTAEQVRICGPLVMLWFLVFAWPLFVLTPDQKRSELALKHCISLGIVKFIKTIRYIRHYKEIVKFLIARILYIDGLNTVFAFGGIYAAGTFHMSFKQVVLFGIAMNVAAGTGSIMIAWLDDLKGSKFTIIVSLIMLICAGSGMLLVSSTVAFWVLGLILSLFVGPVQAASRSLMIRLSPPEMLGEMFGLYAFSGKATAFLGPLLLSQLTYAFHSQRIGMSIIIVLFSLGLITLCFVKKQTNGI